MRHKISELKGPLLNRAVSLALGLPGLFVIHGDEVWHNIWPGGHDVYDPAGDIEQGWPVIKAEHIDLRHIQRFNSWTARLDRASVEQPPVLCRDADPLVAAMRCVVASVYGDEIEMEA